MPLTPLHLAPAFALFIKANRRLNFAALSAGSIIPDIEVPILYAFGLEKSTGHGIMHTIVGAITIDVFFAILAVFLILPSLAGWWEKKYGSRWVYFAGVDTSTIDKLPKLVFSAYIGVFLHIGLDFLTHQTMSYLWPFGSPVTTLPFAREWWWMLLVDGILLVLLVALIVRYLGKMKMTTSPTIGSP